MTRITRLTAAYVDTAPDQLEEGVLYVSQRYNTALHLCCCGCRSEVVTPLNPAKWRLADDDGAISLYPSIGNWSLPCKSHYWINNGKVEWAHGFTREQIRAVQARDLRAVSRPPEPPPRAEPQKPVPRTLLQTLAAWLKGLVAWFKS